MADPSESPDDPWFVYVLESLARKVTYVGIAKDPEARLLQHNGLTKGGAKSTRAARPWLIARTQGPFATRAEAQVVEYALKQKPAREKQ